MCTYDKPKVIVPKPEWSERINNTISLDACIADEIQMLWSKGVRTLSSCCRHNNGAPGIVIEPAQDIDFIKTLVPHFDIYQWELVKK